MPRVEMSPIPTWVGTDGRQFGGAAGVLGLIDFEGSSRSPVQFPSSVRRRAVMTSSTSEPRINSALLAMPGSGIRKVFDLATTLAAEGASLIRLDVGRTDFSPPPWVIEATQKALADGHTNYVANRGIPELRRAIAEKLRDYNGVEYDADEELIVTCGASEAVAVSMFAVLEPGAEVVIPEPSWPHYARCAELVGATAVAVPMRIEDDYRVSPEAIEAAITPRTRMIVLASPGNPTGAVCNQTTMQAILEIAQRHDLLVLADEIYEYFTYEDDVCSFASLPGARERTICVNGFSKAFGMTGFRLGYLAADRTLSASLNKVHQFATVCATSFAQHGAVEAYSNPGRDAFLAERVAEYARRREAVLDALKSVPSVRHAVPGGAFYAFVELPESVGHADDFAMRLLREQHVAAVPGSAFGAGFDRCLRLSYGCVGVDGLRTAVERIGTLVDETATVRRTA